MEAAPTSSYASTYRNLQSAIAVHLSGRENSEEVYRLIKALEPEVAHLKASPIGESETDKVTGLLWNKANPSRADWKFILGSVGDENMFVRGVALDVLRSALPGLVTEGSSQVVVRAYQVLQEQLRLETSPVITYLLDQSASLAQKALSQVRDESVKVQQTPANPYVAGQPIRDAKAFFGRESLIQDIRRTYASASSKGVMLHGGRRTGKTSLLFQILNGALGDEFAPVWIDLQAAAGKGDLPPVILRALRRRWRYIVDDASRQSPGEDGFDQLEATISSILESQSDTNLLLMFDECDLLDGFLTQDAPAARMLSLFENHPRLLALYAGSRALEEIENARMLKLLDNCRYLRVSFLNKADTFDLIRKPAEPTLTYSDEATEAIRHLFAGHPFYTQLLCRSVFAAKDGVGRVDTPDVEAAVREFLASPPPNLLVTWSNLRDDDKLVASALASLQAASGTAEDIVTALRTHEYPFILSMAVVQQGFVSLRREDIIHRLNEASTAHAFTMDFVRRWVAHNQTVWDLLEKRSADVLTRSAPLKRRLLATVVDWAISLVLVTLWAGISIGHSLFSPLVALAYYLFLPVLSERTVGMRVCSLRILSRRGTRLPWWRALGVGALLFLEFVVLVVAVGLMFGGTTSGWLLGIALLSAVALQQARVILNKNHRGFHEGLTRTLIVRE